MLRKATKFANPIRTPFCPFAQSNNNAVGYKHGAISLTCRFFRLANEMSNVRRAPQYRDSNIRDSNISSKMKKTFTLSTNQNTVYVLYIRYKKVIHIYGGCLTLHGANSQ